MVEPVKTGTDIQSIFFDMWRQEHPAVELQDVPGDLVTTSASVLILTSRFKMPSFNWSALP